MRRRWALGLAAAAASASLLALGGGRADAHTIAPGVRNLVDAVVPALPGVTVTDQFTAADELTMAVDGSTPVEVLAPTGEPFLRISRAGVEANTNSVAWYASESLSYNPVTSVPGVVPARGPRWITVSDGGRWSWFDPRLRPDQPADVVPAGAGPGPRRLGSWSIPIRGAGRAAVIAGHREYRPVEGAYNQQLLSPATPFPNVRVAVIGGAGPTPAAYLDDESGEEVQVPGMDGEPFLSFGPGGVLANVASPSWLLTAAARQEAPTGVVSASVPPRWEHVTAEHQFSWLEARGNAPGIDPPPGSGSVGAPETVRRWSFTVAEGGRRTEVAAAVVWQPLRPSSAVSRRGSRTGRTVLALVAGGLAGALVAGGLLALTRRRTTARAH